MRPRKSYQEKILSSCAYTETNKACQGKLSYRRVSELVKKLVKENLLVCTRLNHDTGIYCILR